MTIYGVGEVIYPRQFDEPLCDECGCSPRNHRYVVVSMDKMAADGCDGTPPKERCACHRYRTEPPSFWPKDAAVQSAREEAWQRYPNDAASIIEPSHAPTQRCAQPGCRLPIWFGVTAANHRRCPFDIRPDGTRTGTSHWRTCTDRPKPKPRR